MRALGCLLEYATARARAGTGFPDDVLVLVTAALAVRAGDEAVVTAVGVCPPLLHRYAAEFTAAHPELYALAPGRGRRPPRGCAGAGTTRCCSPPLAPAGSFTPYA